MRRVGVQGRAFGSSALTAPPPTSARKMGHDPWFSGAPTASEGGISLLMLYCVFSFSIFQLTGNFPCPGSFLKLKTQAKTRILRSYSPSVPLAISPPEGQRGSASPFLMWVRIPALLPSVLRMSNLLAPFPPRLIE